MARGLLIGFLAGALLAGIAFKLLLSRDGGGADGAAGAGDRAGEKGGKTPAGGGAEAASQELTAARAESESLRAEVTALKAQLAEAKRAAGSAPSRASRAAKWKELTALIAQAKRDADVAGGDMKNDKWLAPLIELIGIVANDLGVPLQEAMLSPDWYPVFAQSMLDSSPFPLTPEQRQEMDQALAASRKEWDEYVAGREAMSPLERAKALRELQFGMFAELGDIGTQEQKDYMASLKLPPANTPYQPVWNGAGPRAACKTNISNNMSKSLGLDPNQMTSLSPAIDDYMRSYEAIAKEAALKTQAGEPYDDLAAKLALSLEMQKRIGETVRLTDAQAKALKEWTQVYDYQVKE